MTGFPLDAETVRRCSCFGVVGNWGDFGGGPRDCGRPGASNLGFGFSCGLAGNGGEAVLDGLESTPCQRIIQDQSYHQNSFSASSRRYDTLDLVMTVAQVQG